MALDSAAPSRAAGLAAYYGEESIEGRAEYERPKVIRKEEVGGVATVIDSPPFHLQQPPVGSEADLP